MIEGQPAESLYWPGSGWCLALEGLRIVADGDLDHGRITVIRRIAQRGATARELLSAVPDLEERGGSSWGIVLLQPQGARLFLRGSARASWQVDGARQNASGSTIAAWSEHELATPWDRLHLWLGPEPVSALDTVVLPLHDGVVRGVGWVWVVDDEKPLSDASLNQASALNHASPNQLAELVAVDSVEPVALVAVDSVEPVELVAVELVEPAEAIAEPVERVEALELVELIPDPIELGPSVAEGSPELSEASQNSTPANDGGGEAVGVGSLTELPPEDGAAAEIDEELRHLIYGMTEDRSVADAGGPSGEPGADLAQAAPAPPQPTASLPPVYAPHPVAHPVARPAPTPSAPARQPVEPPGLIESFWDSGAEGPASPQPGPPPAAPAVASNRASEPAYFVPPSGASAPLIAPVADDEDVDTTVKRPPLAHLQPVDSLSVSVLSTLCLAGHPNAPAATTCRECQGEVPEQALLMRVRPPLGSLVTSTDQVVLLDRDVVLGRKPAVPAGDPGARPHLVQLGSDELDISKTHLKVQLREWDVLAVDVSSNGILLDVPGRAPEHLVKGQPHPLLPGSRLWLSEAAWVRFEVSS